MDSIFSVSIHRMYHSRTISLPIDIHDLYNWKNTTEHSVNKRFFRDNLKEMLKVHLMFQLLKCPFFYHLCIYSQSCLEPRRRLHQHHSQIRSNMAENLWISLSNNTRWTAWWFSRCFLQSRAQGIGILSHNIWQHIHAYLDCPIGSRAFGPFHFLSRGRHNHSI